MATLVFGAIGSLIGGPVGGSIGALLGRQVDGVLLGNGNREGPRLSDLTATTSTYGDAIPRLFGRMRVPGTIIWSTDLVEHSSRQSTGKNRPTLTSYSYTVSFAVALSSRPIAGIGRIWADGNLLRGGGGEMNAGGTLRIYTGVSDQPADPLIAAAEGASRAPAHRGLAYVVFEDLDLTDFYNRIPTLTFEVIADQASFGVGQLLEDMEDVATSVGLPELDGFSVDGSYQDALTELAPFFPMSCDASGSTLTIAPELAQTAALALDDPAVSVRDDAFGGPAGFSHSRNPLPLRPPEILRYYDVDRDYQTGLQRALGRAGPGQPRTINLPAAMHAGNARVLVERMARTTDWARDTIAWRTATLDPQIAPGAVVTVPTEAGRWRVEDWEWREDGVELTLTRVVPTGADAAPAMPVDGGRAVIPPDMPLSASLLSAFELPWDGSGAGDTPLLFAAVSTHGPNWRGAALYVDHGDGNLLPLGSSGRVPSILGVIETALAPANPLLLDRASVLTVDLAQDVMTLANADGRQLAAGANRALAGNEIIQFAQASPLGGGRWELRDLLRGRGGTESAVAGHAAGESFVLLDGGQTGLDAATVGSGAATILAAGLGDATPVSSTIALRGITRRPLSPVHAEVNRHPDGSVDLAWTRRARAAWTWDDGLDVPLHEQAEAYRVDYGDIAEPLASWQVGAPMLQLDAATVSQLGSLQAGGSLFVRQQGAYDLSEPLFLTSLP